MNAICLAWVNARFQSRLLATRSYTIHTHAWEFRESHAVSLAHNLLVQVGAQVQCRPSPLYIDRGPSVHSASKRKFTYAVSVVPETVH